ncbi:MAG: sialidase family protein [Mycobacteriales bacterium]
MKQLQRWPVAVTLLLAGAAAVAVGALTDTEPVARVPDGDSPVNQGAASKGDISANNSPTIARNPRRPQNLAVANRIDGPRYACALHVSQDGGSRWSRIPIEIPPGEEHKCFAPDVTFTADGKLHLSYVTLQGNGNVPHAGWYASSTDGGRTLSKPRKVLGRLAFQVRLAADPKDPRRLYLSYLRADTDVGVLKFTAPGNPILVSRSSDGGTTWDRPVRVNSTTRSRAVAPSTAVGPHGEVYVLYLDLGEDRLDYEGEHLGRGGRPYSGRFQLVLSRSLDRGATWEESVVERRLVPTERFVAFLPPFPSVAVDQVSGRVYAGFQDGRLGSSDVLVWSLPAGASTWDGPTRVNDTPERDGTSQYLPRLDVAPDGRLDVVYYDRREDPRNVKNDVSLQSSFDHGKSFAPSVTLSGMAFDSRVGYGNERELPDLGSRLGLASDDSSAIAVWSDTRSGTMDSNKQDIGSARVVFEKPGLRTVAKTILLVLGIGLALAALISIGLTLLARPASRSDRTA